MNKPNIQLKHNDIHFPQKQFPVHIVANRIELASNIGSLFRVAEAFGIEKIYLPAKSASASHLKIRKAARSTQKKVDYSYIESAIDLVLSLKAEGYLIVSLEVTSQSLAIREFVSKQVEGGKLDKKMCLILGSEKDGIEQTLLDVSDHTIHIPMFGENTSMNVMTAAAIALYELTTYMQLRNFRKK